MLLDSHVGLPTQSISVWWPGNHFVSLRNRTASLVSDSTVNVTLALLQHVTWGRVRFMSLFLLSFQRINRPILQGSLRSFQILFFFVCFVSWGHHYSYLPFSMPRLAGASEKNKPSHVKTLDVLLEETENWGLFLLWCHFIFITPHSIFIMPAKICSSYTSRICLYAQTNEPSFHIKVRGWARMFSFRFPVTPVSVKHMSAELKQGPTWSSLQY